MSARGGEEGSGEATEIRSRLSSRCRGTMVIMSFSARNETSKGVSGPTPVCVVAAIAVSSAGRVELVG